MKPVANGCILLQAEATKAASDPQPSERETPLTSIHADDPRTLSGPLAGRRGFSAGSDIARIAAAFVTTSKQAPTELSDPGVFMSGRKQPRRILHDHPNDILHFSTQNAATTSVDDIQTHALRWRHNARAGVSSAAARRGSPGTNTVRPSEAHRHVTFASSVRSDGVEADAVIRERSV
jgi:hypothetical protein